MKSAKELVDLLRARLDKVDVPQNQFDGTDNAAIVVFENDLRFIFLETIVETNTITLTELKRNASRLFHPDRLKPSKRAPSVFTEKLKTAPAIVQAIPFPLFTQYTDAIEEYELNLSFLISGGGSLSTFWEQNIYAYPEDTNDEEKVKIDGHNKRVVMYLIRAFNSSLITLLYRYIAYPYYARTALYCLHALVNSLILSALALPLITIVILNGLETLLRSRIENPILLMLTSNYYFEHIQANAIANIIKKLKLEQPENHDAQVDEHELMNNVTSTLHKEIQDAITDHRKNKAISEDDILNIERRIYSKHANNYGAQHLKYVVDSIFISIQRSFAHDLNLRTTLFALLRIGVAIPFVLCLSLPLTLAHFSLFLLLGVAVITLVFSVVLKTLLSFITGLPGFLYDMAVWQVEYPSQTNVTIQERAASDVLYSVGLFSTTHKMLKKVAPHSDLATMASEYGLNQSRLGIGN